MSTTDDRNSTVKSNYFWLATFTLNVMCNDLSNVADRLPTNNNNNNNHDDIYIYIYIQSGPKK